MAVGRCFSSLPGSKGRHEKEEKDTTNRALELRLNPVSPANRLRRHTAHERLVNCCALFSSSLPLAILLLTTTNALCPLLSLASLSSTSQAAVFSLSLPSSLLSPSLLSPSLLLSPSPSLLHSFSFSSPILLPLSVSRPIPTPTVQAPFPSGLSVSPNLSLLRFPCLSPSSSSFASCPCLFPDTHGTAASRMPWNVERSGATGTRRSAAP